MTQNKVPKCQVVLSISFKIKLLDIHFYCYYKWKKFNIVPAQKLDKTYIRVTDLRSSVE
jgi:hypothetical protein